MKVTSKSIKYLILIAVICLVALTGCSKSTESTSTSNNTTHTQQNPVSDSKSEENKELDIDGNIDENSDKEIGDNALGEGIGYLNLNEGSEAIQAFIPEGFPFPEDHDFIEDETMHIENETTNVVNITYWTKTSTKRMYSQYIDYFEEHTEYSVDALTESMLITAISDQKSIYIDITEENDSTKVYISILPLGIPSGAK